MSTLFHAKYWAHDLLLQRAPDRVEALASLGNARVDLNPHQVDAALFALRSPYSTGALLADEVGLGKTIEAALVLAQRWAERRRKILLIVPATLRKQWQTELADKFYLPSAILETKSFNAALKDGLKNPFSLEGDRERIIITSYQFAFAKRGAIADVPWDLVVIDEAHRLRSIYKGAKTAKGIVEALGSARKLLLTATPLQNSPMELYGLVSIIDPNVFGTPEAFAAQYKVAEDEVDERNARLRDRLQHICKRTLRKQVTDYISFTKRFTHTAAFDPNPAEEDLYLGVSRYLQRHRLAALPNTRRKLITMIMRKLLASSPAAIGATLGTFAKRLRSLTGGATITDETVDQAVAQDFETLDEVDEEWSDEGSDAEDEVVQTTVAAAAPAAVAAPTEAASRGAPADQVEPDPAAELADIEKFVKLAESIKQDAKALKLIDVLPLAFELATAKGSQKKAVIFTESCQTQAYLLKTLAERGYAGQIVLMNGTNTDEGSKRVYAEWKARHKARWSDVSSGSRTADMKAAIVEEFRDSATLLIATESAAEGVNLQFCSIVINYDLPWNPQRVEQRIGRCHRYGQKTDVLVVNFLNRRNEADQRVLELLTQKFNLFEGIFGASDQVLGAVESGVDLEKRIAAIYQECRSSDEIKAAFDHLQTELDEKIQAGLADARQAFLENFDSEVHDRLKLHSETAKASLDARQRRLLDVLRFGLAGQATFDDSEPRFTLETKTGEVQSFHLDWQRAEARGDVFLRFDHALVKDVLGVITSQVLPGEAHLRFRYEPKASALARYIGKSGWLLLATHARTAVGRTEESLLLPACEDDGTPIDEQVAEKLFSLRGETAGSAGGPPPELAQVREALMAKRGAALDAKNHEYLAEESEKLDNWAEDRKQALERDLKSLKKEIDATKKLKRSTTLLAERLEVEKKVKALEHKLAEKRKQNDEADREIDQRREELIEKMQAQLASKSRTEDLFTIRWTLEPAA